MSFLASSELAAHVGTVLFLLNSISVTFRSRMRTTWQQRVQIDRIETRYVFGILAEFRFSDVEKSHANNVATERTDR